MKKYLSILFFIFANLLTLASEVIEIPFYYDNEKKSIFVYAEIAGKKGYFLFDTGFPYSVIIDSKERYSNFKLVSESKDLIIFNTKITSPIYYTESVILSGAKLKVNCNFSVCDTSQVISLLRGSAGIIGLDIFKDKIFEISMTDSVIRIYNKTSGKYKISLPIHGYSLEVPRIFIPITVNNKQRYAFVDTGAAHGILLSSKMYKGIKNNYDKIITVGDVNYSKNENYGLVYNENVEIMGIRLKSKAFFTNPFKWLEDYDVLGMKFLFLFDMLFDLRNEKKAVFYYKPRYPYEYFNFFIGSSGLENIGIYHLDIFDQNSLIVTSLIENSAAWKAGLRPGTIITRLNSKEVSEYSIEGIKILIGGSSNLKITYIDSNGKEKNVKVKPKKML